jgi:DNA-binding XRE family transcriptional regulator
MARKMKTADEVFAARLGAVRMAEIDADADREIFALRELRKAHDLTQAQMAEQLGIDQGEVSRIEHRADLYVSTLRRYVEALGGRLHITATFGDSEAEIGELGLHTNAKPPASHPARH